MKFSIIIPVYNDPALRACLAALTKLNYLSADYEVLVIENGIKTDWIEGLVQHYSWRYWFLEKAGSYAARNYGMEQARGDIFAFTDSDCAVSPAWLKVIAQRLADPAIAGIMGLAQGQPDQRVAQYEQHMYEDNIAGFTRDNSLRRSDTRNFAMRRVLYAQIGAFATVRFGGDMEYGARAHAAGQRIVFAADMIVTHQHLSSLKQLLHKRVQQNAGNMELLTLHDRTFIANYFPHLLRYRPGIASRLRWMLSSLAYWLIWPVSDLMVQWLPQRLGYVFFKATNVLAMRRGQLSALKKI